MEQMFFGVFCNQCGHTVGVTEKESEKEIVLCPFCGNPDTDVLWSSFDLNTGVFCCDED
jgi:hypothetical protein